MSALSTIANSRRAGMPEGPPGRTSARRRAVLPVTAAVLLAVATASLVWPERSPLADESSGFTSLLSMLDPALGRTLFFSLAAVGMVVALAMGAGHGIHAPHRNGVVRGLTVAGALVAVTLVTVVPDASALALLGYLPIAVVLAPFDESMRQALVDSMSLNLLMQALVFAAAAVWARETVAYWRHATGACGRCGRTERPRAWTTPAGAARWGRYAVLVAVAVPAIYAITRLAWAFGFALGIDPAVLEAGAEQGQWSSGLWLATFAMLGAVLTLGLVQRWGEVFPRWMVGLAGRPVPIRLATVPATVVAVLLMPAGTSIVAAGLDSDLLEFSGADWGTYVPMVLWPAWAAALGAAAYAYHLRRRPACDRCERG